MALPAVHSRQAGINTGGGSTPPPVGAPVKGMGRWAGGHTERVAARRIPCVGAVIKDPADRLLLIKRGHEPGAGLWSLPGGRIEPGETHQQALAREVLEETNLRVECRRLLGTAELPGAGGTVIDVSDYLAVVTGGELAAGDDAADARWVAAADLDSLPLTSGLTGYLTAWGVYPG